MHHLAIIGRDGALQHLKQLKMKHGLPSTYAFRVSKLNMCLDVCSHSSSEQLVFGHSQGEEDSREREATPIATMDFSHTFSVLLKYK